MWDHQKFKFSHLELYGGFKESVAPKKQGHHKTVRVIVSESGNERIGGCGKSIELGKNNIFIVAGYPT